MLKLIKKFLRLSTMEFNPSALRNKDPIIKVLRENFENTPKKVLMVAEGSGTHLHFFSDVFDKWNFTATDYQQDIVDNLNHNFETKHFQRPNIEKARLLDSAHKNSWNKLVDFHDSTDLIYNCNMVHISPFETAEGLFYGASRLLSVDGRLVMYGPFAFDGVLQPESNRNFDKTLKSRNSSWGIRDVADLKELSNRNGLILEKTIPMPANNHILIFGRK